MGELVNWTTLYTICAVGGSVIMLSQLAMELLGLDHDAEDIAGTSDDLDMGDEYVDTHNLATAFFGLLSFRSIVAAIAFFGIGGRVCVALGFPMPVAFLSAILAGLVAMIGVGLAMQALHSLHSEGNVNIRNCIGATGTVYLTIPGNRAGNGKVTVSVQDRSMEFAAITGEDSIETGTRIVVVGVPDVNTLEVVRESSMAV